MGLIARPMEVGVELARRLPGQSGHGLELLARGADNGPGRAEVVEQRPLARGADARQAVEDRLRHRAVAAGAGGGDGESGRPGADPPGGVHGPRWGGCRAGVSWPRTSGAPRPGMKISSIRFASETIVTPRARKPSSARRPAP